MASPLKRLKLNPKKCTPRGTQDSKVTSTPQCSLGSISSPNVSNISSFHNIQRSPSIINLTMTDWDTSSISDTLIKIESGGEVDYDDYFKNLGKIKYTGHIWKMYKPETEKSLYGMIISDPPKAQEIANVLLDFYERNPHQAMYLLIKFCIDVCGFQNINITNIYKFDEESAKKLISLLETEEVINENSILKNTNRYLFMESSGKLVEVFQMSIHSFLQKCLLSGHDKGILYNSFIKNFFVFVKCMSLSNLRCVCHTGVVFAIKLLTALVKIQNAILVNDLPENSNSYISNMTESPLIRDQRVLLDYFIEYFYFVFVKNCRLQDNKLVLMRVECIKELTVWIIYFPKLFLNDLNGFDYLTKFTIDASKEVRQASISAFQYLMQIPHVFEFFKSQKEKFKQFIANRFYDLDCKVAVGAINIFTSLLELDASFISDELPKIINSLIYDENFSIGVAACKFLGTYFIHGGYNSKTILIKLATLSILPGTCRPQLLIEGCLHIIPEVKDLELFCFTLLQREAASDILESLARLLFESMYQTLKGQSSKKRQKSPITITDSKYHLKAAKCIPVLNEVLHKFSDHPNIFSIILKCFNLINHNIMEMNFCKEYTDLCTIIRHNFHTENEDMLHQMVNTLNILCTVSSFLIRAKKFVEILCEREVKDFRLALSKLTADNGSVFLRIAVLYSKFNLNDKFTWESLFDICGEVSETDTGHILECCYWYLIWSVRGLTDPLKKYPASELSGLCIVLKRELNEFISTCFNMLQNLTGQKLHYEVYKILCGLLMNCHEELEIPIKTNKQFEFLRIEVNDRQLQTLLARFLDTYVINREGMRLEERRENFVKYVNMVHKNILPTESLADVFKYYHSHNAEYGPIIDSSLNAMTKSNDVNTIFLITLYTLTKVYDDILEKHNVVDITTEEANKLKLLTKQFLAHSYFRTPRSNFKKFLYLSLKYVIKNKSNYTFLHFVKYFTVLISDVDDHKEIYDYFCEKLTKNSDTDDIVLFFVNHMKTIIQSSPATKVSVSGKVPESRKKRLKVKKENIPTLSKGKNTTKVQTKQQMSEAISKTTKPKTLKKPSVRQIRKPSNEMKKKNKKKENPMSDSETNISEDDLTIHDSESDMEVSLVDLRM